MKMEHGKYICGDGGLTATEILVVGFSQLIPQKCRRKFLLWLVDNVPLGKYAPLIFAGAIGSKHWNARKEEKRKRQRLYR